MRILVLIVALMFPALVHAGPSPVVGKWKLVAVRTKAGPVAKDKLAGGGMIWHFKAGGALEMTVWKGKDKASASATWKVAGATVTVNEHGKLNKMTFKRKGAKLELAGHPPSTVVMTFQPTK